MLDMRIESMIYVMRQNLMPSSSDNEHRNTIDRSRHMKGLIFSLDLQFFDQVDRSGNGSISPITNEVRRNVHIMVAGFSSAFVSKSMNHNWEDREWLNLSNHESEWLTAIGTELTRIYFELCTVIDAKQRPCDIGTYNSFAHLPLRFVDVTWVYEDSPQLSHSRKIVEVRKLTKAEFDNY